MPDTPTPREVAITALVGTQGDREHGAAMVDAIERAGVTLTRTATLSSAVPAGPAGEGGEGGVLGYVWRVGTSRLAVVGRLPGDELPTEPRQVLYLREGGHEEAEALCAALNAASPRVSVTSEATGEGCPVDLDVLEDRYTSPEPDPCRVCGAELSIQSLGGDRATEWACSVAGVSSPEAMEHYRASKWTQPRNGDPDVRALVGYVRALTDAASLPGSTTPGAGEPGRDLMEQAAAVLREHHPDQGPEDFAEKVHAIYAPHLTPTPAAPAQDGELARIADQVQYGLGMYAHDDPREGERAVRQALTALRARITRALLAATPAPTPAGDVVVDGEDAVCQSCRATVGTSLAWVLDEHTWSIEDGPGSECEPQPCAASEVAVRLVEHRELPSLAGFTTPGETR